MFTTFQRALCRLNLILTTLRGEALLVSYFRFSIKKRLKYIKADMILLYKRILRRNETENLATTWFSDQHLLNLWLIF